MKICYMIREVVDDKKEYPRPSDYFKTSLAGPDLFFGLREVDEKIRERLKYGENISDSEEKFLDELRELIREKANEAGTPLDTILQ